MIPAPRAYWRLPTASAHAVVLAGTLFAAGCMAGCRARAAPEKARPAEVSRPVKESELGTIALTEDAARNLGWRRRR